MEIIVKYDFTAGDAATFSQEEIIKHVKNNFPDSLCIYNEEGESFFSDEDEPRILVSKRTTLITTDLEDKLVVNFNTGHSCILKGLFGIKKNGFGYAIEALKEGKRVMRQGWNSTGKFIFLRPADKLHIDFLIDKVKSIPQSVKNHYLQDVLDDEGNRSFPAAEDDLVDFTAYLCLKAEDGTIVNGWLPSQRDILSEDWKILD